MEEVYKITYNILLDEEIPQQQNIKTSLTTNQRIITITHENKNSRITNPTPSKKQSKYLHSIIITSSYRDSRLPINHKQTQTINIIT